MAVIKCKMCGGDLVIEDGLTVAECEYCGTKQTVPNMDNDKKISLFARANRLRLGNEFDRAAGVYESIVADFQEEAEAYWGLVLCKYGIEYVDDPVTGKKIPTCHRSSFESIMDDGNFELTLEYADSVAKKLYREEAKQIEEIRKGIIEVSAKEEPYDIFICYKETDEKGERTIDSVLAQDIYEAVTEKGYRTFFARITLEDKLGQEYEPYIFAALNSAKIMLAVGTDYECYNAVWVKNEWSRFLQLMSTDKTKHLIPCYKNIDAYDMPKEFAKLQAQDLGKVGAMQDLIRGIEKILPKKQTEIVKESVVVNTNSATTAPLLQRVFMFLEDGNWNSANEYCEKVLDVDPECAEAYLGKLMVELKVRKQDLLKNEENPFDNSNYYQKAIRFADEKLKATLKGYIEYINGRNEKKRLNGIKEAEKFGKNKIICDALFEKFKAAVRTEKDVILRKKQAVNSTYELKQRLQKLLKIKSMWNVIEASITSYNSEIQTVQATITRLNSEKSNLGFFSVRRKNGITAEITNNEEQIRSLMQKIAEEESKKGGFSSLESINNEISQTESKIDAQNKVIDGISDVVDSCKIRDELSTYDYGKQILSQYSTYLNDRIKVGGYIKFGSYPQTENGDKEDIEWRVLKVINGRALVISRKVLDRAQYNTFTTDVTWDTCTLREWLNNDFFNSAFSADEKAMISTTTVSVDTVPYSKANPGKATQDKVFLLSINEVEKYFILNRQRQCRPTDYAVAKGSVEGYWLLRSPGKAQNYVTFVHPDGRVDNEGLAVGWIGEIRPALWIDLNA